MKKIVSMVLLLLATFAVSATAQTKSGCDQPTLYPQLQAFVTEIQSGDTVANKAAAVRTMSAQLNYCAVAVFWYTGTGGCNLSQYNGSAQTGFAYMANYISPLAGQLITWTNEWGETHLGIANYYTSQSTWNSYAGNVANSFLYNLGGCS